MRCSSSAKSPSTPCCTHPTRVGAGRLSFWCSSARVACGCPSVVLVSSRLTHRTCVPHGPPLIVRAGGSCPRVFVTLRLLSDGSCRRAFRIHLGCDRTSGSKLLQHVLKGCCEKITLWVFAGHWLRAPRTREWTGALRELPPGPGESPAHAGMDRRGARLPLTRAPRAEHPSSHFQRRASLAPNPGRSILALCRRSTGRRRTSTNSVIPRVVG